jgi:hypothetical protein
MTRTVKYPSMAVVQYTLETLFLITTALAFHLAVVMASPLIGVMLMAVGLPALARTIVITIGELRSGRSTTLNRKLDAYFASLAVSFLAVSAVSATLLGASVLLSATALLAMASTSYVFDFLVGAVGVLGCLGCLAAIVPLFYRIYWQTLPAVTVQSSKFQVQG